MNRGFRWVEHANGTHTLLDEECGQAMHSRVGPWTEAMQVYVEQSGLQERLTETRAPERPASPLVIHDVGLGLASNSLAALETASQIRREAGGAARPLRMESFELKPEGLALALEDGRLDYLQRWKAAARALLSEGCWKSEDGALEWRLHRASYLEAARAPVPAIPPASLIYYDFYAPKTCPDLWTAEAFSIVHACAEPGALLITYSAATHVRNALRAAGWEVSVGPGTEAKRETTLARRR